MKLDRNTNKDGKGRYALLKLRLMSKAKVAKLKAFMKAEKIADALVFGDEKPDRSSEFFVVKIDDEFAGFALENYGLAVLDKARKSEGWLARKQPCGCILNEREDVTEIEHADYKKRCGNPECVATFQMKPVLAGPRASMAEFSDEVLELAKAAQTFKLGNKSHPPSSL